MRRFERKCSSQIRILTIKWRLRSEIGMMLHSKLANKLLQLSNNSLLIMTSWPKIPQLKGLCLHHIEWSPITLKVLVKSSKMLFCMSALSKLEKLKWRRQTRRRRSVCGLFNKNTCAVSKCLATELWKRLIVRLQLHTVQLKNSKRLNTMHYGRIPMMKRPQLTITFEYNYF